MNTKQNKSRSTALTVIGRAERIELVDFGLTGVPSKVDTGADTSSMWASDIVRNETTGELSFKLFGSVSEFYTGESISLKRGDYDVTRVASSNGHRQVRYAVTLRIRLHGRTVRTTFTLTDRSHRTYPVLLGRRLLHKKFLVDVSRGDPLTDLEKVKRDNMRLALNGLLN